MKTITVWIKHDELEEVLYRGSERIRMELAEEDKEGSQIDSVIFDPNREEEEEAA